MVRIGVLSSFVLAGLLCLSHAKAQTKAVVPEKIGESVDSSGRVTDAALRSQTGWETIRSLEWQLELRNPSTAAFAPVDPRTTFRHGEQFRLRIKTHCDLYVYVLVLNSDGTQDVLMPQTHEKPPLVKKGVDGLLPDSDVFVFQPPEGESRLRLLVSARVLPWVASKELFKVQNGERLTAQEEAALANLKAVRSKSIAESTEKQRDLETKEGLAQTVAKIRSGGRSKAVVAVMEDRGETRQQITFASGQADSDTVLVHDIGLKHR